MVINNRQQHRFELDLGGHKAIAAYRLEGKRISFVHTEVPPELEGQGVGGRLIAGALDQVRDEGLQVVPLCSFVRHYIETHAEAADLLA